MRKRRSRRGPRWIVDSPPAGSLVRSGPAVTSHRLYVLRTNHDLQPVRSPWTIVLPVGLTFGRFPVPEGAGAICGAQVQA